MPLTISDGADVTYADPVAHFMGTAGKYWLECTPLWGESPKQNIGTPGVNGVAVSRNSDAYPDFPVRVAYVSSSANSDGGYATDMKAMQNHELTLATPQNGTFTACELVGVEPETNGTFRDSGFGTYYAVFRLRFRQKREDAAE